MDTGRELSPQERKRLLKFEALFAQMEAAGWKPKYLTWSLTAANVLALPAALPFALAVFIPYYKLHGTFCPLTYGLNFLNIFLMMFAGVLILSVVHELIHGLTWGIFAKNHFSSISFGFILKSLNPYCNCSEPLKKWQYITGALMPIIVLGIIPGIFAVKTGSILLLFMSILMIFGGGGDILIVLKLLFHRSEKAEVLYCDHPTDFGAVAFER